MKDQYLEAMPMPDEYGGLACELFVHADAMLHGQENISLKDIEAFSFAETLLRIILVSGGNQEETDSLIDSIFPFRGKPIRAIPYEKASALLKDCLKIADG